jgi:hypothetical protein
MNLLPHSFSRMNLDLEECAYAFAASGYESRLQALQLLFGQALEGC